MHKSGVSVVPSLFLTMQLLGTIFLGSFKREVKTSWLSLILFHDDKTDCVENDQ